MQRMESTSVCQGMDQNTYDTRGGSEVGDAIDVPRVYIASGPDEVDHEVTRKDLKDSCFSVTEGPVPISGVTGV